mgnify:CR=1 FL=1
MSNYNANLWDDRPYRPTSVTISIDEWDRMNEELQALRQWKEAAIKSSSWNVKHEGKPYTWTSGKYDRYTDLISELMANQTGVSDPIQILTKHPIKDVQIGPYNFQSISDPIQKAIELLPAFIEIQGVQFEFSLFLNGPDMRLVYSISSVEEGSSHFEMWSQHGCWENLFFDGTTQGFLWLREGIGSVLDLLEAVKDCEKFLVENKLNPTHYPETSKEYNQPTNTATVGQTLGMDGNWQPKKDEDYFAWDTDFGVQSFVNLNPEMGRIDMEKYGRLFPTKEATEAYGRTTTTNALLPLMELKMAVDRGETIVDEVGNTIVKHPNGYDYNSLLWLDGFTKSWEAMVSNYMSKSKGWRIERTEPDNYSEILAELHLGKTFQAEDGTEIWKRRNDGVAGVGMGIALIAPWSDVVEQILKRHKGWRKV